MKKILFILLVMTMGLGFAASDLSDPQYALGAFLIAIHDFSADRIWSSLSSSYREELESDFAYMKQSGDLGFFADTFNIPELLNCNSAYQVLCVAMQRIPGVNPVLYQQTREQFAFTTIYQITGKAVYTPSGSGLKVTLPDNLGSLSMVQNGGQWKIADASDFYIMRYY